MGHNHKPQTLSVSPGKFFVDSGSWTPLENIEKEKSDYKNMTYVVIDVENEKLNFELKSWN